MKIYLDTNVILDFLLARKPFDADAILIFELCLSKKIQVFISAISYTQIAYFLEKGLNKNIARNKLRDLQQMSETIAVDNKIISAAIASPFNDFEDAMQHACALQIRGVHSLVTRNTKDFKSKEILIQTPKEFLTLYNNHNE